MKTTVEVIRPVLIPAGSTLDGQTVTADTWARKGKHKIDHALMVERLWHVNGFVEPESTDGKPVVWGACCTGHA